MYTELKTLIYFSVRGKSNWCSRIRHKPIALWKCHAKAVSVQPPPNQKTLRGFVLYFYSPWLWFDDPRRIFYIIIILIQFIPKYDKTFLWPPEPCLSTGIWAILSHYRFSHNKILQSYDGKSPLPALNEHKVQIPECFTSALSHNISVIFVVVMPLSEIIK